MRISRILTLGMLPAGVIGGGLVAIYWSTLIATGSVYGAISLLTSLMALGVAVICGYYAYVLGVFSYTITQQAERFRYGEETDSVLQSLSTLHKMCQRTIEALFKSSIEPQRATVPDHHRVMFIMHVYSIKSAVVSARVERSFKTKPLRIVDQMISNLQKDTVHVSDIQWIQGSAMKISKYIRETRGKNVREDLARA